MHHHRPLSSIDRNAVEMRNAPYRTKGEQVSTVPRSHGLGFIIHQPSPFPPTGMLHNSEPQIRETKNAETVARP
jgi:hypothetical protein